MKGSVKHVICNFCMHMFSRKIEVHATFTGFTLMESELCGNLCDFLF